MKSSRIGLVLARVVLGVLFIVASLPKILHPLDFAEAVSNYRLISLCFVPFVGVALPWVELLAGTLSLVGVWLESAMAILGGLSFVFAIATLSALVRGLDIRCGCFQESQPISWAHPVGDAVLVGLAVYFLRHQRS